LGIEPHQHLVILAQAYLFNGDRANLDEIQAQLESWFDGNPYHRGINWASALKWVSRLSWIWVFHLTGASSGEFRARWLRDTVRHGVAPGETTFVLLFAEHAPAGEALALHVLGLVFRWSFERRAMGAARRPSYAPADGSQVHSDGSHFEQSTYYHVYAWICSCCTRFWLSRIGITWRSSSACGSI